MAVKIVRRPNQIALLGAPTSAAALLPGHEQAPRALRDAGLVDRLRSIGYEVFDHGDDPVQLSAPDNDGPRARNISAVLKLLEAFKPRVESAVKSGALPLILGGDCSIALAVVAGLRRYYRSPGMIYMDRDADLNTPATTPSGCVDGMVVSHLIGRGAAELVRFWGEPPLVREPDLVLFGVDRLDPPEEEFLVRSPLRRYLASDILRKGAAAAAKEAVERLHGARGEFVLHFDVDVISDFPATNYPGERGLSLLQVQEILEVFITQKNLVAVEVTAYNPLKDHDASGANTIIDILVRAFAVRAESLQASAAAAGGEPATAAVARGDSHGEEKSASDSRDDRNVESESHAPAIAIGETWSSDALDEPSPDGEGEPETPASADEAGKNPS
ncbi:MAG TPA: arginase family protein [Candidatus Acidoferrum sp.]|nr:arginase family protein [Candidatus Acidoferrum sp.]